MILWFPDEERLTSPFCSYLSISANTTSLHQETTAAAVRQLPALSVSLFVKE
ncbi:MAG: hypothetical protein M1421_02815 [Candidatus Eremiobacteraeota bacterium]|nr:hypothetical protein [Candidatus Eremiobacteraeota bacterium]